jgi:CRISPR-associated endonuclease/helicase Cas3
MVFSALVDTDFLDIETHFNSIRTRNRTGAPGLCELWDRFEADQANLTGQNDDWLNRIRHEIYQSSITAAMANQGIFTLTVPTGGGKTR